MARPMAAKQVDRPSRWSWLLNQFHLQRGEQVTDAERTRASLQQTVTTLNGTLAERNDRLKALEEAVAQHTTSAAQLRGDLERTTAERSQLVAGAAYVAIAIAC